jgi:hypothetical protein
MSAKEVVLFMLEPGIQSLFAIQAIIHCSNSDGELSGAAGAAGGNL